MQVTCCQMSLLLLKYDFWVLYSTQKRRYWFCTNSFLLKGQLLFFYYRSSWDAVSGEWHIMAVSFACVHTYGHESQHQSAGIIFCKKSNCYNYLLVSFLISSLFYRHTRCFLNKQILFLCLCVNSRLYGTHMQPPAQAMWPERTTHASVILWVHRTDAGVWRASINCKHILKQSRHFYSLQSKWHCLHVTFGWLCDKKRHMLSFNSNCITKIDTRYKQSIEWWNKGWGTFNLSTV